VPPADARYPLRAAFGGILLFVLGLGIAGGVYQINREEQAQLQGWQRADGTVIELLTRRSPDGDRQVPVIAFTTPAGERISFTMNPPKGAAPYYINAPVEVIYHPDHPQDALIDGRARRWTRNALGGAAALVLLGLGGYVTWYASRWDRMAPPRT